MRTDCEGKKGGKKELVRMPLIAVSQVGDSADLDKLVAVRSVKDSQILDIFCT